MNALTKNKDLDDLIEALGYRNGIGLIDLPKASSQSTGYAYLFRRAYEECRVKSVYTLTSPDQTGIVPLVYLADAESEPEAAEIHRKVWNQNLVPFLIVSTPERYVLYSGFRYELDKSAKEREIEEIVKGARVSLGHFRGLEAQSIADGSIWTHRGKDIVLEERVDQRLLQELEKLGQKLRESPFGLSPHQAHALIGKFVYLRYLRDREILSNERLADWEIDPKTVFGRNSTQAAFAALNTKLDAWLNGSVFPVDMGPNSVGEAAIRQVASVFYGDTTAGQMSLFEAYDFAFIPIETLSVIYQQFLHAEKRGKSKGAYYTPVHLVDLILDEVETRTPLQPGVTVLDPACGSGAFLVQAYRRIVERRLAQGGKLHPDALSDLLTRHIFGVEQDEDACRVANLSLVITLLDYVDPPDLRRYEDFKLPALYGGNIVQGDFFDPDLPLANRRFHCIVGNPPWLNIKNPKKPLAEHIHALRWMQGHQAEYPIGNLQLAEAFAWKVGEHLLPNGAIGLLMPAMSLFKSHSQGFRSVFFRHFRAWCVVNFANLAYVLFGGRVQEPAAVLFYGFDADEGADDNILTYAPFLAHQPAMQRAGIRKCKETWALTVDAGELRRVDRHDAVSGKGMTWKLAMWGSYRDRRLLNRVAKRFPDFTEFRKKNSLIAHQGLELRTQDSNEPIEYVTELSGAKQVAFRKLPRLGRFYDFPTTALKTIQPEHAYVRRGRVHVPLSICKPPHLVVGRNREWAVYSDEFLVIPNPQLGIAGMSGQEALLKALALYLVSDFVRYYQLFHSTEMGIRRSIASKADIEILPVPFDAMSNQEIAEWENLYDRLRDAWRKTQSSLLLQNSDADCLNELEHEANERVFDALGLSMRERWLVTDLVHERMRMLKGKIDQDEAPENLDAELSAYGEALADTLNDFIGARRHQVEIHAGKDMVMAEITLNADATESKPTVRVHPASDAHSRELTEIGERLVSQHQHWLYFERRLTLFHADTIYLVKPRQRLLWTRSQALLDADELIADTLSKSEYRA